MADYSKEYIKKKDLGFKPDFSVWDIFNNLEEGHYKTAICEGYGFVAILKNKGECEVAFGHKNTEWVKFKDIE